MERVLTESGLQPPGLSRLLEKAGAEPFQVPKATRGLGGPVRFSGSAHSGDAAIAAMPTRFTAGP